MQVQAHRRSVDIALLTVGALLVPVILASGAGGAPVAVKLEPSAQTVLAMSSFCLNVTIENVINLGADQATLQFEPQALQVAQVSEGAFLRSAGTTLGAGSEIINNASGFLTFHYTLLSFGRGVNGSGTLASIVFTANVSTNATTLVTLSEVILADAGGIPIHVDEIANATVNIVAPVQLIFDTGRGSYPSISGIHHGTITPSSNLTVRKLYTYPCPGTAGHAEYARLSNENDSWSSETVSWPGYSGEWHYLNFPQPITLQANVTYYYTIRTASSPQLIRLPLQETTHGTITCSEFTDANGNTRSGWIPAIRLE